MSQDDCPCGYGGCLDCVPEYVPPQGPYREPEARDPAYHVSGDGCVCSVCVAIERGNAEWLAESAGPDGSKEP